MSRGPLAWRRDPPLGSPRSLSHDFDGIRFVATRIRSIAMSTSLLIGRLVFGSLLAVHGAQKLFGWFGGYGLRGTGTAFEGLGFRPGRLFAAAAGAAEFGGGLLLGLIGALASLAMRRSMPTV